MTDPLHQLIDDFYAAIIRKEVETICASYRPSARTYVFVEGPRYSTLGYDRIAKGWADFCRSGITLKAIRWLEGPFTETEHKMAWIAGVIRLVVTVGEKTFEQQFRATFVLRKDDKGPWRIMHEHVSAPLKDPYGIGDWLKEQNA